MENAWDCGKDAVPSQGCELTQRPRGADVVLSCDEGHRYLRIGNPPEHVGLVDPLHELLVECAVNRGVPVKVDLGFLVL